MTLQKKSLWVIIKQNVEAKIPFLQIKKAQILYEKSNQFLSSVLIHSIIHHLPDYFSSLVGLNSIKDQMHNYIIT